eukprot:3077336-Amphidinium_carterae.1
MCVASQRKCGVEGAGRMAWCLRNARKSCVGHSDCAVHETMHVQPFCQHLPKLDSGCCSMGADNAEKSAEDVEESLDEPR